MPDPTFHFIVVVDVEGFGKRTIPLQSSIRTAMYDVVSNAFSDVDQGWGDVVKLDRGDGIMMLIPVTVANSVTLSGRFVDALNERLREKSRMFSADHQMRLRVALHQGNCHQDANGWVGEALNTTARLVDAPPLRKVLAAATDASMAFIVSDEIYHAVVRHGYRHIDPASFASVDLDIKELHERAWIQVPGHSFPPGLPTAEEPLFTSAAPTAAGPPAPPVAAAAPPSPGGVTVHGPQVNADGIHGDFVIGDKFTGNKTTYGPPR